MNHNKRNTKTKQMVMSILEKSLSAMSHEEIEQKLTEKIDRVTVYRILNSFCDDGKVHKIVGEGGKTYYSRCRSCTAGHHNDNHAHFLCTECRSIVCIEEPLAAQPVPKGYNVSSISAFLTGTCPECNKTLLIICMLFCGFSLFAQSQNVGTVTDTAHVLPEIVVSGYSSQLQGENVANVEKLNLKTTTLSGISLSDKLTNIAGLDNYSSGIGIGKPVIRGLSGNRIAVFSQGIRIENQQWGDEHGLGLDGNGYEQVEVIKGPASLLYGSDALGGVLFFADERYAAANSMETALNSEFHSNTGGLRNTGAFKLSRNKIHFNIFGGYTTHRDYYDGYNNPVPNSRFNTADIKSSIAYTGNKFLTSLKYNYLTEKYGLTENDENSENIYRNGRKPEMPHQDLATHILGWENTLYFNNNSKFKLDFAYVFNSRKEFENFMEIADEEAPRPEKQDEATLNMRLNTLSYSGRWYSPRWNKWELIAGSQGMYQINGNYGEEILIPDASTLDVGAFAMTNFYYGGKSYMQSGVRFDSRHIRTRDNIFDNNYFAVNFSTGIFQSISKKLTLRTNLSTGFRAPNMFELLSDGVHEGVNRYEIGNEKLKTENSYQVDASLNFKTTHTDIFFSPYFNHVRNFIYLQPTADIIDETPVYNYLQTNAFLYGGETGIHFHPHPLDWLHVECSYSGTFGQDTEKRYLPLLPSQKLKTNVSVIFTNKNILKRYLFYAQNLYSFAQNSVAEYETSTPSYNLLNIGAGFEFHFGKQQITLNVAANNLLNTKYFDHLSRYKNEGIYNMGRNFVVKVAVQNVF
ncbi:MAG: TonB-dependent receptor [Dysgonamonadaceae bacterium]|jgi:iron complex outermembrane receptor protein|nr:TonB-dependent receptor [Dysgonamonadaceae bacterium]